jgi:GntR family transcriptional regulator / MocR family aminotransferase
MQLPLHIDSASRVSLRQQLVDQLRQMIVDGLLAPGSKAPSTRALSLQLSVARNTVVRAYEKLIGEGYLEARSAAATFVCRDLPNRCTEVAHMTTVVDRAPDIPLRAPADLSDMRLGLFSPPAERMSHDFRIGRPDASLFPKAAWRRLVIECLGASQRALTDYGDPAGLWPLRAAIVGHLRHARGIRTRPDEVIVVAGSQEGLNLVGRLLSISDATVAIEDPCYQGAAFAMKSLGARLCPVPVDEEGFDVSALGGQCAKLAYVTPSHQFPLGFTMSVGRRGQLLEWAHRAGAYILEDDYDSDFRYQSSPLLALKALDRHDRVIYLGTFSKSIGPGLRLGYVVVPEHLAETARRLKALMNNGHPWLDQAVVSEFVGSGAFQNHLVRIRKQYLLRRDRLMHELEQLLGPLRFEGVDGGMHLTCHLPDDLPPTYDLQQRLKRVGVGIYSLAEAPVARHTRFAGDDHVALFGYPCLRESEICEAIGRLGRILAGRARSRPVRHTRELTRAARM